MIRCTKLIFTTIIISFLFSIYVLANSLTIQPGAYYQTITMIKQPHEELPKSSNGWKSTYINYITNLGNVHDRWGYPKYIYKLVNINNDSIPELYINFGSTASGDVICTYYEGKIIEQPLYNYGLSYIEGQNIFRDAGGHMDEYYDQIYSLINGQFIMLHNGTYGAADNSQLIFDSDGNPIYNYYWDGTEVYSKTQYMSFLNNVYNTQQAVSPFDEVEYDSTHGRYVGNGLCDYEEILATINSY